MTDIEKVEEKLSCGLSVAERDLLQKRLNELEDTMPAREVWQRIQVQAHAEGLLRRHIGERTKWFAGASIAAAILLAAINLPIATTIIDKGMEGLRITTLSSVAVDESAAADLSALLVQSKDIERDLRMLPVQPKLVRVGTAVTITEIEDRIAEVDFYLNQSQVRMNPLAAEIYWRERVRLMNSLLDVRSAQVQRVTFD